ncbi:MAG: cbb3-type cytochrome oxidase assembly protein CcoS [Cytophagales bacterium]|nr:cbb3-type cytochrome oxidase assembly protein CcoS [Cytophagales bacterium]
MIIIVFLICISLCIALFFLATYIWAVKSGQYDDTYSPGIRILFDDQSKKVEKSTSDKKNDIKKSE